ncbi:hypothetical protein SPRG_11717 [Saprolegnia parasitica CBS 223.65]|uniref:Uncharacterized protein n=1 Tax=Saprolegnia parasitica (strain CBS 223.65) TaxID=695850 RepID=A0A067C090_SAPPC|nr:hypothetical protein SPRG_11717 [Saprolegnia parasitica CBS 223.65]KDO22535.1 hypothetical protein SPRG_11717 [Saprolegnia parasitica CBS 223.65]|eukprot:XP_012206781.1 hypothetical protein SPRG_11717 [Saprolegnia parasitica CBS 223.65]
MVSIGSNVTSIFTLLFQDDIPNNLNDGKLENMFFAVGAVSAINLSFYIIVMRKMQFGICTVHEDEVNEKDALIDQSSNLMSAHESGQ